jgi:hypothetical protein
MLSAYPNGRVHIRPFKERLVEVLASFEVDRKIAQDALRHDFSILAQQRAVKLRRKTGSKHWTDVALRAGGSWRFTWAVLARKMLPMFRGTDRKTDGVRAVAQRTFDPEGHHHVSERQVWRWYQSEESPSPEHLADLICGYSKPEKQLWVIGGLYWLSPWVPVIPLVHRFAMTDSEAKRATAFLYRTVVPQWDRLVDRVIAHRPEEREEYREEIRRQFRITLMVDPLDDGTRSDIEAAKTELKSRYEAFRVGEGPNPDEGIPDDRPPIEQAVWDQIKNSRREEISQ